MQWRLLFWLVAGMTSYLNTFSLPKAKDNVPTIDNKAKELANEEYRVFSNDGVAEDHE
ncbi:hypothetical protein LA52FAK_35630 [Desulforhopalus sp. 52FAK]